MALSNSYDRTVQKRIRLLAIILVVKSFIGATLAIYSTNKHIKLTEGWKDPKGYGLVITSSLELLGFLLGIFMSRKTKQVVQILELEFFNKEWSNYFQINSEF